MIRTNDSITRCGGNNLFSCWYPKYALAGMSAARMLAIDECEEWIWHILDCTKDCGFEYISDADKEFLIFNTNDFFCGYESFTEDKENHRHDTCADEYPQLSYSTMVCQKQKSKLI